MSDKITIDKRDSALLKENNLLKTDDETATGALNDGLAVSANSKSIYSTSTAAITAAINKLYTNSVYGSTIFTDKAIPSISITSTKPEVSSVYTEIETKVENLLNEVAQLKSRIDELEKENKLLRSRVDKADTEDEELRYRDEVLERHISELKLKFML